MAEHAALYNEEEQSQTIQHGQLSDPGTADCSGFYTKSATVSNRDTPRTKHRRPKTCTIYGTRTAGLLARCFN